MSEKEQWEEWNKLGFIPGPDETEEEFVKRVAYCQNLESHLRDPTEFPFKSSEDSERILTEALPLSDELYGITPKWVPLFFSNYQLTPWHGGCAWIFQLDENSPTAAFLQLRAQFRKASSYLGLYRRNELIGHELAHVGRMQYVEPQFEELLAYQSSPSKWRRFLGPIVQSSKESLLFILLLGIVIMADFALLSVGPSLALVSWGIKLAPILLILLGLARLIRRHRTYNRCLIHLQTLFPSKIARHLLYRLLDKEIQQFSHYSPFQIQNFIEVSSLTSFRWNFLKSIYLK